MWETQPKFEPTEEQKQMAYKMLEEQRVNSLDVVEKTPIKEMVDMWLLSQSDITTFRTAHVSWYLKSILEICVTIPNIIETNQQVLVEIEDGLSKFELEPSPDDENFSIWMSLMWHRRATINQINNKKEEIENRKSELENYKDILVQFADLI